MDASCALDGLRSPALIYLVHRTHWSKYFAYRKWRCDERMELMGAYTTLEGAQVAATVDFRRHAFGTPKVCPWMPELRKDMMQRDVEFDKRAAEELFRYINQFMMEKKMEDKQVDQGWTYRVTQTTLTPVDRKRKLNTNMKGGEEILDEKASQSKLLLLEDSGRRFSSDINGTTAGHNKRLKEAYENEPYRCRERRSLGYFCQE